MILAPILLYAVYEQERGREGAEESPLPVKNWLEPQRKISNWFEPSQCVKHQKCSKIYLNFRINAPILFFLLLRI